MHLFPASSGQVNFKSKIEYAGVAELADAIDLGSIGTTVQVQVLSPAPMIKLRFSGLFCSC